MIVLFLPGVTTNIFGTQVNSEGNKLGEDSRGSCFEFTSNHIYIVFCLIQYRLNEVVVLKKRYVIKYMYIECNEDAL